MSSHHIIRENQEPALFVKDAGAVDANVVGGLLEWSPLVILSEEAIPFMINQEFKVDAVLVYNPVLNWKSLLEYQWPVEILFADAPILSLKEYFKRKKISEVNLIDSFENMDQIFRDGLKEIVDTLVIYSGNHKYHFSKNGRFEKWLSPGKWIHLTEHKEYNFSDNLMDKHKGRLQVKREGIVSVSADSDFWIAEIL